MMSSLQSAMKRSVYKDRLQALQTWHVELICLSNQHLQNVLEFLNFCEATESEFEKIREEQRLQHEQIFQLESLLMETIEKPQDTATEQHDSGGRLRNVIERIRRAVELKKEENQGLQLCRDRIKKFEAREEKLASLVKNLQNLTAELEQALEKRDSSDAISTEDEGSFGVESDCSEWDITDNNPQSSKPEEDGTSYDVKDIEQDIEKAAVVLENYCARRWESEDDGSSSNNYIRFKRSPSEALNNFLRLLENHSLQLCDEKRRFSHKIEHRSVSSQTEQSLCTFESSSLHKTHSRDVDEPTKSKLDNPVPERILKPIILVEPFNQKCSSVGVTTAPTLPPPPVDPMPHSLEDRYQEIAKALKLQANFFGGFSPHHYYLDKMGEIIRFYSDEGYQLFEQFQLQKYVSVITARSATLDTDSALPDVTLRIGFGGTKLEATEMAVQNTYSHLMDNRVKSEAVQAGDNVIHHSPTLGNNLACGDGPHIVSHSEKF